MKSLSAFLAAIVLTFVFTATLTKPLVHGQQSGQQDEDPRQKLYKEKVPADKLPKDKFRKGDSRAIPGEYIVVFVDTVKESDIDAIVDEIIKAQGGVIKDRNNDVWKKALKGFVIRDLSAVAAQAISLDPRVDHVTENITIPALPTTPPKKGGTTEPHESPVPVPENKKEVRRSHFLRPASFCVCRLLSSRDGAFSRRRNQGRILVEDT